MAVRYAAKTPDQIHSREVEKTSVGAWSTMLVVTYQTDPDVVASVLPPPLEPSSTPLVKVTFAGVDIPGIGAFGAGSFSVQCVHDEETGYYCLVMPMSTEQSVIGGRETFGEPKKIGEVVVELDGDSVRGAMTRMGVTFAEFRGQVTARPRTAAEAGAHRLLLQGTPRPRRQGTRLRPEPRLLHAGGDRAVGEGL